MHDTNDQITQLFIEYHDSLERYANHLVHGDPKYRTLVDEAVQEAFYKALHDTKSFKASPNPQGWLAICCKNHIRSKIRQGKRRAEIVGRHVSFDACYNVEASVDAIIRWIEASDARQLINSIRETLTEKEKIVFTDYYERDCTLKETAERNGMPVDSVRGTIQRIRSKAKKFKLPMMIILIGQCIIRMLRTV